MIIEGACGKSSSYAVWYPDKESLFRELDDIVLEGDTVIVKGSNAYRMSEVADRIVKGQEQK